MIDRILTLHTYRATWPGWFLAFVLGVPLFVALASMGFFAARYEAVAPQAENATGASSPSPSTAISAAGAQEPAIASTTELSAPASEAPEAKADQDSGSANPGIKFAIIFCTACSAIALLVLIITLPIYLFSRDADRIKRAGGLVKTTLGFFITSGGAVLATLKFT